MKSHPTLLGAYLYSNKLHLELRKQADTHEFLREHRQMEQLEQERASKCHTATHGKQVCSQFWKHIIIN